MTASKSFATSGDVCKIWALTDSRVLLRLQVQMRKRLIKVTTVSSDDCTECKKAS